MPLDVLFDLTSCASDCPYCKLNGAKEGNVRPPLCGLAVKQLTDVHNVPSWCPLKEKCKG